MEHIRVYREGISSSSAWLEVQQYENIKKTSDIIINKNSVPKKHVPNALKQAKQIRFCLIQAREYFKSSQSVGLATKPLLMYYCIMNLAIAEYMLKQDGNSSIEKVRGSHSHHGLDKVFDCSVSPDMDLATAASRLKARPHLVGGQGVGTFELWHRTARESPCGGSQEIIKNNNRIKSFECMFVASKNRLQSIRNDGLSLLDCYRYLPIMSEYIKGQGILPALARATFSTKIDCDKKYKSNSIIVHPDNSSILNGVYERMMFHPGNVPILNIESYDSGMYINWINRDDDFLYGINFPIMFQYEVDKVYLSSENDCLNEFGIMYVALYILGMYSRYFPEKWMMDIENSSSLSMAALYFMNMCEERMALCALSSLSGVNRVRESLL